MCWRRPLLSLVCLAVWSSASAEPTIEPLSMLRGGEANDVLVKSGYAYVATNRGLDVFDVSDPDRPVKLLSTDLPGRAEDVEFRNGVFYVGTRSHEGGIEMFLQYGSDPHHFGPVVGSGVSTQIQIVGDFLYTVDGGDLYVWDLSAPLSPLHVGTLTLSSPFSVSEFLVVGDVVWLIASYPEGALDAGGGSIQTPLDSAARLGPTSEYTLMMADVSNPAAPVPDYSFWWGKPANGPLNVVDGMLHLFEYSDTRRYLLPSMDYAGRLPVDAYNFYPVAEGQLVNHNLGLSLLQDATEVHELRLPGAALEGSMVGNFIYRAADWYGWQIIDASDPFDLQLRSRQADPIHLNALVAEGDVVYAVGRELFTIDVSAPAAPELTYQDPAIALDAVAIGAGGHLFTDGQYRSIRSYDIDDPTTPVFLSEQSIAGDSVEMVERNGRLFVATKRPGLLVLDCSDPASGLPEIARGVDQYATRIAVGPEHAYVGGTDGYLIYDIRDPSAPQVVGQLAPDVSFRGQLIAYDHLFVMPNYSGVQVYSLQDPEAPALVLDGLPGPIDRARAMDHEGIHLAVADETTIYLYDIRDPAAPIEVASAPLGINENYPDDIDLHGDLIHIARVGGYVSMQLQSVVSAPSVGPAGLGLGSDRNPARGFTRFWFEAPVSGPVELKLYDVRGRLVRSWAMSARHGTQAEVYWDGTDRHGQKVASGTYFLRARAGNAEASHRMVWMK